MENQRIEMLISRYNEGTATEEEIMVIENLIERGVIEIEDLTELRRLDRRLQRFEYAPPPADLDVRFYEQLAREKRSSGSLWFTSWFNFNLHPGLTFATASFFLGMAVAYFLLREPANDKIQALNSQVTELKEMMMLSLLEKESATDRLKAVNLTQELRKPSESVTRALIATMNNDENVNVRLAALDALRPYVSDPEVRAEIIRSIGKQDSPLVQVALADLMAALQEKSSIKEFDKLLESERTPDEVKKTIRERINVMI